MTTSHATQPLSSAIRRGAYHKGLLSETERILTAIERYGRQSVMKVAADEVDSLVSRQTDCQHQGDLVEVEVISGRVAAWRFQIGARRV